MSGDLSATHSLCRVSPIVLRSMWCLCFRYKRKIVAFTLINIAVERKNRDCKSKGVSLIKAGYNYVEGMTNFNVSGLESITPTEDSHATKKVAIEINNKIVKYIPAFVVIGHSLHMSPSISVNTLDSIFR